MRVGRRSAVLAACGLLGCLELPVAAGPGVHERGVELSASDARGMPTALDELARRPLLELTHARGFAGVDAIVLLAGSADEALTIDLDSPPLRAEHAGRSVSLDVELRATIATLSPRAALEPAAHYTLAVFGSAKAPDGKPLFADRAPVLIALRTSGAPDAGAAVRRAFPADGATGVAVNLAGAVIAFDGTVLGAADGVWLEDAAGGALAASVEDGPCAGTTRAFAPGFCVRVTPRVALAPLADYALVVGAAARDGSGAAVGPFRARFRTGTGRDERAPATLPHACALDEQAVEPGCMLLDDRSVLLRVQSDEPVLAELGIGESTVHAVADQGELAMRVAGLAPGTPASAALTLTDAADNVRSFTLPLRILTALATVSISEVRADPVGPEPAQEYVELHNFGAAPVELVGLAITDDPLQAGVAIERSLLLDPGARALLVPSAFDPRDERDGPLPPGVTLLRAQGAIAGSGLKNTGELLLLRDAQGRRLSGAPATPKPRTGVCVVRTSPDPRDARAEAFAYDAGGGCTPGF